MSASREVLLPPGCAVFWDDQRFENTGQVDVPLDIPDGVDAYVESLDGEEHPITWIEET